MSSTRPDSSDQRSASFGSKTVTIPLKGARCDGIVVEGDSSHDCPFEARYLMLAESDAVIGLCGHHVNEAWAEAANVGETVGRGVWDAHDVTCDHIVTTVSRDGTIKDDECSFRASVLICWPEQGYEHAACRHHARDVWLERTVYSDGE